MISHLSRVFLATASMSTLTLILGSLNGAQLRRLRRISSCRSDAQLKVMMIVEELETQTLKTMKQMRDQGQVFVSTRMPAVATVPMELKLYVAHSSSEPSWHQLH